MVWVTGWRVSILVCTIIWLCIGVWWEWVGILCRYVCVSIFVCRIIWVCIVVWWVWCSLLCICVYVWSMSMGECVKNMSKSRLFPFIELYVVVWTRCRTVQYFLMKSDMVVHSHWNAMFLLYDLCREHDKTPPHHCCKSHYTINYFSFDLLHTFAWWWVGPWDLSTKRSVWWTDNVGG